MLDITENVSILENLKLAKECSPQKVDIENCLPASEIIKQQIAFFNEKEKNAVTMPSVYDLVKNSGHHLIDREMIAHDLQDKHSSHLDSFAGDLATYPDFKSVIASVLSKPLSDMTTELEINLWRIADRAAREYIARIEE